MNNILKQTMKSGWSLLFCSIAASSACVAQENDSSIRIIKEGVEIVICFPDSTKKVDTLTIEQFIESQPQDDKQRNRNLRNLNEMIKKEPE